MARVQLLPVLAKPHTHTYTHTQDNNNKPSGAFCDKSRNKKMQARPLALVVRVSSLRQVVAFPSSSSGKKGGQRGGILGILRARTMVLASLNKGSRGVSLCLKAQSEFMPQGARGLGCNQICKTFFEGVCRGENSPSLCVSLCVAVCQPSVSDVLLMGGRRCCWALSLSLSRAL